MCATSSLSSVNGHLSCLHILAVVNIRVHVSFQTMFFFFLDICPIVGLLDHKIALLLVFRETSILFSIVVVPIYISKNSVGGFPFLHILSCIYCSQIF